MSDTERMIVTQIAGLLNNMQQSGLGSLTDIRDNGDLIYTFDDVNYLITVNKEEAH